MKQVTKENYKPIIICVDDEKMVLDSLREQLNREFMDEFDVQIVESAEAALELFDFLGNGSNIALVISDQIMPGMKGDELLTRIHVISPKTINILLTGQASPESIGNAVNRANLYRYIAKPWDRADLCLTVKEATRRFQLDKSLEEKIIDLKSKNERLESLITTLNKFVPRQFLDILNLKTEDYIPLGACSNQKITTLFSDIRSFTTIAEGKSSLEIFKFINDHCAMMGALITEHQGFIDKYIGDSIMAIFLNADQALSAGIEMHKQMEKCNYSIGISVNSGEVIMGTVGEPDRLQTTVLGDSVNVAAKVEPLNKIYKTKMIITGSTLELLEKSDQFSFREIDTVKILGKSLFTTLYEILNVLPEEIKAKKIASLNTFKQAILFYKAKEWIEAKKYFEACIESCPEDDVVKLYLSRIEQHLRSNVRI